MITAMKVVVVVSLLSTPFVWGALIYRASTNPCFWAAIDGPYLNRDYARCFPGEK